MPLLIHIACVIAALLFEVAWHFAGVSARERELQRYERVEHPRRAGSDHYIDTLC